MNNIEQMQELNDKVANNTMEINSILEVATRLPVNQNPETLVITPSKDVQTYTGLYDKVSVYGEPDLVSENIKEGVNIFGVEGSAKTINAVFTNGEELFCPNNHDIPDIPNNANEFVKLCDWKQFMSCKSMFSYNKNLTRLTIKNAYPNNITDTSSMFNNCSNLIELDFGDFDTSNVTNMRSMFSMCYELSLLNLSNFNTSNVMNMYNMFYCCRNLTSLDLSNFDTSKVTDMYWMFYGCSKLETLTLGDNFRTALITNMANMFNNCSSLTSLDVSSFDTSKVTDMNSMFGSCINLTSLDLSNFDTSNVTNMRSMFSGCSNLTELDLSGFDMSNVINISGMFQGTSKLTNLKFGKNLGKAYTQTTENYSNYGVTLSYRELTHDSLMDVINNLYDLNLTYDVANGGTLYRQKLEIGYKNTKHLTAEEIAIATNKGWNVT